MSDAASSQASIPTPPPAPPLAPLAVKQPEAFSLPLEVLRTLHAASANRWEKRREYEWKLSYAVWTALAGFIATVLLGKDSRFEPPQFRYVAGWLGFTWALHGFYLVNMVQHTLEDLRAQTEIEYAIRELAPLVEKKFIGAGMRERHPALQRYGLIAQLGITLILCSAAGWFSYRHPQQVDVAPASPTVQAPSPKEQLPTVPPVAMKPATRTKR